MRKALSLVIFSLTLFVSVSIALWQKPTSAGESPPFQQTEQAVSKVDRTNIEEEDNINILKPGRMYPYIAYGGELVAGSGPYAVEKLKYGIHPDFERLVFYISEATDDKFESFRLRSRATVYDFALLEGRMRAEILLTAERNRAISERGLDFSAGTLVEKVENEKVCDWIWYAIKFKQPVQVKVFELYNPGRIVIDVRPMLTN